MGKKGRDHEIYNAPTKAIIKQMQHNATRSGAIVVNPPSPTKSSKWDWNAVKLNDAKWSRISETRTTGTDCPSLLQICIRFLAAHIQLYVERDANTNVNASTRKPAQTHARNPAENQFKVEVIPTTQDHAEVKPYQGYTYAHLAGSLMLLPLEIRDEVLLCALRGATLRYAQVPALLHPGLCQLDLSHYGKDFSHAFVDLLLPKLSTIDTDDVDDWEQIDAWTIHESYKGCPNLTYLDLSNCVIYPHKLQQILNSCPIKNLKLSHYPLQKTITTPSPIPLSKYITGAELQSKASRILFSSLPALKHLIAKDNTVYPDFLINMPGRDSTIAMKRLQTLNLSGNTYLTGNMVVNIAASYDFLRSLDVSRCSHITNPTETLVHALAIRPLLEINFGNLKDVA